MAANQKSGNNNKLMMTILKGRTFIVSVILLISSVSQQIIS